MSNIETINAYLYDNRIVILGYLIFIAWWAIAIVTIMAAAKMKYGLIPCIINWIGIKIAPILIKLRIIKTLVKPSECLKWFQKRPVYLVLHPIWMFSISVAIALLTSLYENKFHIRKEVPLILSIFACIAISIGLLLAFKHIRKYEPYN